MKLEIPVNCPEEEKHLPMVDSRTENIISGNKNG
jgi:hypothetical protein